MRDLGEIQRSHSGILCLLRGGRRDGERGKNAGTGPAPDRQKGVKGRLCHAVPPESASTRARRNGKLVLEHVMKSARGGKLTDHRPCGLQQHGRQPVSLQELTRKALECGCHRSAPAHLFPSSGYMPSPSTGTHIAQRAPNTDFVIYNIPQLAGVALTHAPLLRRC